MIAPSLTMTHIQLFLFGPPRLQQNDLPLTLQRRKVVALLAYLAQTGRPHSRESLAALFWPNFDQSKALANLRRELTRIRKEVGDILTADRLQVAISDTVDVWVDTAAFLNTLTDHTPIEEVEVALSHYTAPFMDGFTLSDCPDFDEWQFFQREKLQSVAQTALRRCAAHYETQKQFSTALPFVQRLLQLDPLEEATHRHLMKLYALAGQPGAAVRQFKSCKQMLADELGVMPDEETLALYEEIKNRRFEPPKQFPTRPSKLITLPSPLTPMIGREKEKAALTDSLLQKDIRLVTIQGAGGIGKTRLALDIAHDLAAQKEGAPFADGIIFVSLAPLNSAEDLMAKLAETFAITSTALKIDTLVLNFLRTKQMLLILDNFEHIMAGTDKVLEILQQAPSVSCLITSRERLRLNGEWVYRLDGLSVSPGYDGVSGATQLFLNRISPFLQPDQLSDKDCLAIEAIGHQVQGMPLALILAAGWADMLSLPEIAAEIGRGLDILSSELRDIPQRQRSMRAVFDTSWEHLPPDEKRTFASLSVFRGGFTREAAEKMTDLNLLPILRSLVNKSLIQPQPHSDRYEIHELLRQIGAEKLAEMADAEAIGHRHAAYYLRFAAGLESDLKGGRQLGALQDFNIEFENIRTAWRWASTKHAVDLLDAAEMSVFIFFDIYSRYIECLDLYRTALFENASSTIAQRLQLRIAYLRSWISTERCQEIDLDLPDEESIKRNSDKHNLAFLPMAVGFFTMFKKQAYDQALGHFQESLQRFQQLGDTFFSANLLQRIGYCYGNQAQTEQFFAHMHQSLELAEATHNDSDVMKAAGNLIISNFLLGDLDKSLAHAKRNIHLAHQIDTQIQLAFALSNLAFPQFAMGNLDEARESLDEALAIATIASFTITLAYAHAGWALFHVIQGEISRAQFHIERGWENHPNTVVSAFLNLAEAIVYLHTEQLDVARQKLVTVLSIGLLGQVSGLLIMMAPAIIVYLMQTNQRQQAAELWGLINDHQQRAMIGWGASWSLFAAVQQEIKELAGQKHTMELFSAATRLLNRLK
ncbi:MAG: BTAD domain-containing putative transcriptional regulator [Ardenticatenaceae bacterium]|nr:BTAD domain-containing putative transcriptional regulator [Ardenticatenaceae bacterium]